MDLLVVGGLGFLDDLVMGGDADRKDAKRPPPPFFGLVVKGDDVSWSPKDFKDLELVDRDRVAVVVVAEVATAKDRSSSAAAVVILLLLLRDDTAAW